MPSFRERLEETHSSRFELGRHFFRRFFDSDFVSAPGQLRVVAGGLIAVLLSSSILFTVAYYHKYLELNKLDDPTPFRLASIADVLFIISLSMALIGLFTTLQWTSLFPGLRDYLALAALPFRPRDLFIAKFAALSLCASAFVVATTALPSLVLPILQDGTHSSHAFLNIGGIFIASSLAALFMFFLLVALQGLLLNLLPLQHFQRISLTIQAALLVALLCAFPLILSIPNLHQSMALRPDWANWLPPLWFLGIHQVITGNHQAFATHLAWLGIASPFIAAATATATYLWSYRRHRVRVLESTSSSHNRKDGSRFAGLLDFVFPDARRLAVFSFMAKTLARSRPHRLILSGFTALALAVIFETFIGLALSHHLKAIAPAAVSVPLALSLFVLAGFRYLFRLPVELRANWVFRLNESGNRLLFLSAVERFLGGFAILPVAIITLPVEITLLGPLPGIAATVLCIVPALILMEVLLFEFDQIPFTSAYLPGRRPVIETLVLYGVAVILYVTVLGAAIAWSLSFAGYAGGFFITGAAILWRIRSARQDHWLIGKLLFEELPEPAVQTLNIYRD